VALSSDPYLLKDKAENGRQDFKGAGASRTLKLQEIGLRAGWSTAPSTPERQALIFLTEFALCSQLS